MVSCKNWCIRLHRKSRRPSGGAENQRTWFEVTRRWGRQPAPRNRPAHRCHDRHASVGGASGVEHADHLFLRRYRGRRSAADHASPTYAARDRPELCRDQEREASRGGKPARPGIGEQVTVLLSNRRVNRPIGPARFVDDSLVEGDGFELPVPREKKSRNLGIPLEFN